MKTTVVGTRLNDYQREHLKKIAGDKKEGEVIRVMVDALIEGDFTICRDKVVIPQEYDVTGLVKIAEKKKVSPQRLIDEIVEQLSR